MALVQIIAVIYNNYNNNQWKPTKNIAFIWTYTLHIIPITFTSDELTFLDILIGLEYDHTLRKSNGRNSAGVFSLIFIIYYNTYFILEKISIQFFYQIQIKL